LWEDTLIVAYMRAGHGDKAASRISGRLDRRPSARDEAWARGATKLGSPLQSGPPFDRKYLDGGRPAPQANLA
jgi:hypothetical protein